MPVIRQIPLLKDHHSHPFFYAALGNCIDLRFISQKIDALNLIRQTDDDLIVAIGWNNSLYWFEKRELDALPPTVIINASVHGYLINHSGIEMLQGVHPDIIRYRNDKSWIETNYFRVLQFLMGLKPCRLENLIALYDDLLNRGVWYAEELSLWGKNEIALFKAGGLCDRSKFWVDLHTFKELDHDLREKVHGIKIFADGALGPKTAKFRRPYLNGGEGFFNYTDEALYRHIKDAVEHSKPNAIHVIGDLAIDQVIMTLIKNKQTLGVLPEIRMEHCQFISRETAQKAKTLGIVLSMQPNFSTDSTHYKDRLSQGYCTRNNPFRMLIDEIGFVPGEDLILGSDGMPHGVQYALESALFPPYEGQRLTLDEFVAGYCMPDETHGHIEVLVDEEESIVTTKVIISKQDNR